MHGAKCPGVLEMLGLPQGAQVAHQPKVSGTGPR